GYGLDQSLQQEQRHRVASLSCGATRWRRESVELRPPGVDGVVGGGGNTRDVRCATGDGVWADEEHPWSLFPDDRLSFAVRALPTGLVTRRTTCSDECFDSVVGEEAPVVRRGRERLARERRREGQVCVTGTGAGAHQGG